jgi:predicted Rossmann fold flavoprotein
MLAHAFGATPTHTLPPMQHFDAVIIGAGAAGLFCAGVAAQRGLDVLVLDHSEKVAEKIRISGGGRSNFTNRDLDVRAPQRHFISDNPHFCRSALSRYTPQDFIGLVQSHGIPFHEKHKGQLFCDRSADDLIAMLLKECAAGAAGGHVTRWQPCSVKNIHFSACSALPTGISSYELETDQGQVSAPALVVATGGLSIPKIGATDFGYRLARQFGLNVVPTRPALVPLTFDEGQWQPFAALAGLSLEATLSVGEKKLKTEFLEDLLFTHRGLSGPGVLQISSYWHSGQPLTLNLAPGQQLGENLQQAKRQSRKLLTNELARWLPARLADAWCAGAVPGLDTAALARPSCDVPDKALAQLADSLQQWRITPNGTEGYRKAEVTAGGVDTKELSQQTMEAHKQPGLYFIGEVVDVTGWLGGYNFQWAWASAHACAQSLKARTIH